MNRGSGIAAMADGFRSPAARTPADLLRGWQMVRRTWEEPKLERERGFPNCTRITQHIAAMPEPRFIYSLRGKRLSGQAKRECEDCRGYQRSCNPMTPHLAPPSAYLITVWQWFLHGTIESVKRAQKRPDLANRSKKAGRRLA